MNTLCAFHFGGEHQNVFQQLCCKFQYMYFPKVKFASETTCISNLLLLMSVVHNSC